MSMTEIRDTVEKYTDITEIARSRSSELRLNDYNIYLDRIQHHKDTAYVTWTDHDGDSEIVHLSYEELVMSDYDWENRMVERKEFEAKLEELRSELEL